jgi:hypothetical protein
MGRYYLDSKSGQSSTIKKQQITRVRDDHLSNIEIVPIFAITTLRTSMHVSVLGKLLSC